MEESRIENGEEGKEKDLSQEEQGELDRNKEKQEEDEELGCEECGEEGRVANKVRTPAKVAEEEKGRTRIDTHAL